MSLSHTRACGSQPQTLHISRHQVDIGRRKLPPPSIPPLLARRHLTSILHGRLGSTFERRRMRRLSLPHHYCSALVVLQTSSSRHILRCFSGCLVQELAVLHDSYLLSLSSTPLRADPRGVAPYHHPSSLPHPRLITVLLPLGPRLKDAFLSWLMICHELRLILPVSLSEGRCLA